MQTQNSAPQSPSATEVAPSRDERPTAVNQPVASYDPVFFVIAVMAFLAFLKAYVRS
mgnify:CR=1 FL=1